MTTSIYALLNFTATDGTSCTNGNVYSLSDSAAFVAYQRGQAQPAELQEDVNASTLTQLQYDAGAKGVAGVDLNGGIYDAAGNLVTQKTINPPAGFPWQNYGFNIFRAGSGISTDFSVRKFMPAIVNIWYVDPVNGNDGTAAVNDRTKPLLNLATAIAKTETSPFGIAIINLTSDYVGRINKSANNVQSTQSFALWVDGSYRYISVKSASSVAPTWTVNGTYPNVYQTTITAANSDQTVDLSLKDTPSYTDNSGNIVTVATAPKAYKVLTKVASIAAVAAQAGTSYHDGTNLYVRAHDDRNLVGDNWMQPLSSANNFRFPTSADNLSVYVEGVDFVGGTPIAAVPNTTTATGGASGGAVINTASTSGVVAGMEITGTGVPAGSTVLSFVSNTSITISQNLTTTASGTYYYYFKGNTFALENCTVQTSNVTQAANGLAWQFPGRVYQYNCWNYNCGRDGFNYHSPQSDAGVTLNSSPYYVEVNCGGFGAGTTGSSGTSDNNTTSHDRCVGISINGAYINADDRVVADTDYARRWMLGGVVGQAVKAGPESIAAIGQNGNAIWIDSVTALNGSNPKWTANTGAGIVPVLNHYNSGEVVNTAGASGVVVPYNP